jgi:hypothetical protein
MDKQTWAVDRRAILRQIRFDAIINGDGWSLLCKDQDDPDNDIHLQSMNMEFVINNLIEFMEVTDNPHARFWLHARAGTGTYRGIAYCHGFTDLQGQFVMHNGIINSKWPVDSFSLATEYPAEPSDMLDQLVAGKETFANIFLINEFEYAVIRVAGGRLHTDGAGNFSTNQLGFIRQAVPARYCEVFYHQTSKKKAKPLKGKKAWHQVDYRDLEADDENSYSDYWLPPAKVPELDKPYDAQYVPSYQRFTELDETGTTAPVAEPSISSMTDEQWAALEAATRPTKSNVVAIDTKATKVKPKVS